jgi:dTDP-4-dehydrorhamnose reductase
MDSICILGAGGFIGSHVAKTFPNAVALRRADLDLTDAEATRVYFSDKKFKLIINCAAIGGSRLRADEDEMFEWNVAMFSNVRRFAKYDHMIWFSSGAADKATTPYGAAKKIIEDMAKNDPKIYILKIWGCFGPGEPEQRLLATGIREGYVKIAKDRLFDFIHVSDVILVIKEIINSNFNLGPKFMNMIYPESPTLLSDVLTMAKIPFIILNQNLDDPYTGICNVAWLKPVLKERVQEYVNEGRRFHNEIPY